MDFKQWAVIVGIFTGLAAIILGLFFSRREEFQPSCTPLTWRRCILCGTYAYTDQEYCYEHMSPAPALLITPYQLTRVTNAIYHKSISLPREARYVFGSFFLALEEHSRARWTAREAYGAYKLASQRYQEQEVF